MKQYEKYKATSIKWIGEVPSHWEETKLKYVGYLYAGLTGKGGDDFKQIENPSNKPFIPFTNIANNIKIDPNKLEQVVMSKEDENQNQVMKGDLFFMMSSENFDDVGKSTILVDDLGEVYLNSFCKGFRVVDKNVNPLFLSYLLHNDAYRRRLMIEANGFTRINLKMEKVNDFFISLPPLKEQNAITNFLDEKTAQIEILISNKQKLIELLKEERTTIINEAVSGEGKNWNRKKLKYVTEVNSDTLSEKENEDLLIQYIDIGSVDENGKIFSTTEYLYSDAPSRARRIVKDGDTILSTVRTYLKAIAFIENAADNLICSTGFAVIRPNEKLNERFLFLVCRSQKFIEAITLLSKGVSYPSVDSEDVKNIEISFPLLKEQTAIVQHVQTETQRIDNTISKIEKEIELMQEYRTALISEVVTGKIKVV